MTKSTIQQWKSIPVMLICFLLTAQQLRAQAPALKTSVDKNTILIGEPVKYKVTASYLTNDFKVKWFAIPDSAAHFELVEKSKIDTVINDNLTTLEQTITYTSFDSGRWNTPGLAVNFDPVKDDTTFSLFTDSIPVNVVYAPADSTNQLRDIKPIMDVKIQNYLWYYIIGAVVLLLIIGYFVWQYFKKREKKEPVKFTSKLSAYDEAMQKLKELSGLNLQDAAAVKQYHAELSAIFKWYITRRLQVNMMNKTTSDVLVELSGITANKEIVTGIATALRVGDAVKFAKYLPPAYESEQSAQQVKAAIDLIHSEKQSAAVSAVGQKNNERP